MAQGKPSYRFAVDSTLGKLAKWLRLMGFDASYRPHWRSQDFVAQVRGGCVGLVRSERGLRGQGAIELIIIRSDQVQDQLRELIQALDLRVSDMRPFTRCLQCNTAIVGVEKPLIRGKVPDYIWQNHSVFHTCQRCGRIFWAGSHTMRGRKRIQRIFDLSG